VRFGSVSLLPINGNGPEDVVVDAEGWVFTGLEDGRIIRVSGDGTRIDTIADTGGRPLGIELYGDDGLVVCDSERGLLTVDVASGAVRTLTRSGDGAPLVVCNNAAVAADGTIYFSDSSSRFPVEQWRSDLIEQTGTGRLLRRAPDGTVDTLARGLQFANGVALTADESCVAVAETGSRRVRRVRLTGARQGEQDVLLDNLAGYPDNIATGSDGLIWVTQASPHIVLLDVVRRLPSGLRALARHLPDVLQPQPADRVGVLSVDGVGRVRHERRGEIAGFRMLSGVREHHGTLYFGSLTGPVIARTRRD